MMKRHCCPHLSPLNATCGHQLIVNRYNMGELSTRTYYTIPRNILDISADLVKAKLNFMFSTFLIKLYRAENQNQNCAVPFLCGNVIKIQYWNKHIHKNVLPQPRQRFTRINVLLCEKCITQYFTTTWPVEYLFFSVHNFVKLYVCNTLCSW